MALYTCQKVIIRDNNLIDVRSEIVNASYTYQLSESALQFVAKDQENAGAFVKESKGAGELLMLYNYATGEVFIPSRYSEIERIKIKQKFNILLLKGTTYKFIEM